MFQNQKGLCLVEGCSRGRQARGFCRRHYARWLRYGDPLGGGIEQGGVLRWLRNHAAWADGDCLFWPFASKRRAGNGWACAPTCTIDGKKMNLGRATCTIAHGEPPSPAHYAALSCGNGHLKCLHPAHLYWATPKESQAGRWKRAAERSIALRS
jgi:hypothetical protein